MVNEYYISTTTRDLSDLVPVSYTLSSSAWVEQPCCHEEQKSTLEASHLFLKLMVVLLEHERLLLAQ